MGIDAEYSPIAEEIVDTDRIDRERARELRLEYAARLREDVASL